MDVLMGIGSFDGNGATRDSWRRSYGPGVYPHCFDGEWGIRPRYFRQGLPTKDGYAYTYQSQMAASPGPGTRGAPLRFLPLNGLGAATPPTVSLAPTHRLVAAVSSGTTNSPQIPLSADDIAQVARSLPDTQGRITVIPGAESPIMYATSPGGVIGGKSQVVYYYQVDVALNGTTPEAALRRLQQMLEYNTRFAAAGLQVVNKFWAAVGESAGAAAGAVAKNIALPLALAAAAWLGFKYMNRRLSAPAV